MLITTLGKISDKNIGYKDPNTLFSYRQKTAYFPYHLYIERNSP